MSASNPITRKGKRRAPPTVHVRFTELADLEDKHDLELALSESDNVQTVKHQVSSLPPS